MSPAEHSGRPTVGLAIICHQRPAELAVALRSAEGQGFDEILVADMASEPALTVPDGVRPLRSERNLGVSGGRNRLVAESTTDVVVFLDDDAVLGPNVCARVRELFDGPNAPVLVAFRVGRPGGAERWEQPFRLGYAVPDRRAPASYFVGAGHAVRREAYLAVGGYDERLFYATQELDLSFKLLGRGGEILYDPAIEVEHRPSARGRTPPSHLPGMLLHDRLLVVRAHLPCLVAIPHVLAWATITLRDAVRAGGLDVWRRALGAGLRAEVDRHVVSWALVLTVHRRGGRVLF